MGKSDGDKPSWLVGIPEQSLQMLCIARQVQQAAQVFGGSPATPTGQLDSLGLQAIFSGFHSQLRDLEQRIPSPTAQVSIQLRLANYRLSCFGLQLAKGVDMRQQMAVQLYTSCIQAIEGAGPQEFLDWQWAPRSVVKGMGYAAVRGFDILDEQPSKQLTPMTK